MKIHNSSDELISKECVDSLIKEAVAKIEVTPINKDSMSIDVILKNGETSSTTYSKEYRCSDIMKHLMIPQQQFSFDRNSIRRQFHKFQITYYIAIYC